MKYTCTKLAVIAGEICAGLFYLVYIRVDTEVNTIFRLYVWVIAQLFIYILDNGALWVAI